MDFNDRGCEKHTKDAATNPPSLRIWPQFTCLWRCLQWKIAAAAHVLVLGAFPARIAIVRNDDDPDGREDSPFTPKSITNGLLWVAPPTPTQPLFRQVS